MTKISFDIPAELLAQFRAACVKADRPMANQLRALIREFVSPTPKNAVEARQFAATAREAEKEAARKRRLEAERDETARENVRSQFSVWGADGVRRLCDSDVFSLEDQERHRRVAREMNMI